MPVISATQKAEAGELLEPGRQRLQRAKIVPLHSSVGSKNETPSQKKSNCSIVTLELRIGTISQVGFSKVGLVAFTHSENIYVML